MFAAVAAGEAAAQVVSLAAAVERACESVGFAPEARARVPHVTIARVDHAQNGGPLTAFITEHRDDDLGQVDGDTLILFESELQATGSHYSVLTSWPLGTS